MPHEHGRRQSGAYDHLGFRCDLAFRCVRAAYRPRLFFADVTDEQKIAWNTNRTGTSCVADDQLPKVDRGTYVAQLSLKDDPKVQSKPQTITVE
mgnify:CR=1 FL=1